MRMRGMMRCQAVVVLLALAGLALAPADAFTAESLQGMKFSALKRLAAQHGISDAQMDVALESSKPKQALVELLAPFADSEGSEQPPPPPQPPPQPQPPPPPPPAKDLKFCECDWSIGTWTQPQSVVDHRGLDLTQDGVELCELSKSSGPDSGCVFALGGLPQHTRKWMQNTRECYMISGRGMVAQRELAEPNEKVRCSPPEGAVPEDRVTLFGRVFERLPSADSSTIADIKADFAVLKEKLAEADYTRESLLLIGQRPYTNPSFVDLYTIGRPTGNGETQDLVRFFAVALPLERSTLEKLLSQRVVERLVSLGAVKQNGYLLEPMVHIFPVEGHYYFTDVNNHEDNSIYKFGPDTLGMTSPVADVMSTVYRPGSKLRVLDLCTGSGVQGINAALHARAAGIDVDLNLVDINSRSLRFVTANLMMNGLDDVARWHEGDLFGALPESVTSPHFDVILANPPYWPAHNKLLFHAGGLDGEAVTKRVVSDGTPLLKDNGLMFIVTPIFNTDKAGPGSAPVLERIRSWGWPASMKSVVLYGSTREDKDFYDLFNAKKPPITKEMLDHVGIINAAEEGLMVMGKCAGEQHTWQVAQRSPLAWAALSGCGYRNTWVECLKDSNAQLRKDLSKQLINFAASCTHYVADAFKQEL